MNENTKWSISSAGLHIMAMIFMLCDHLWGTILIQHEWLTCIGRIAFPIFAFLIVEGFIYTSNLKRYMSRLFICAVISEIPFNLMIAGTIIYPYHQNVLWTFLLSLLLIIAIEKANMKYKRVTAEIMSVAFMLIAFVIGCVTMVDYYGAGILTVIIFHSLRAKKGKYRWVIQICQVACMYVLNVKMLGGYCYLVPLFGHEFEIPQQALALLALIPIWCYKGKQGLHTKSFKYFYYAFYPAHMLILALIRDFVLQ